tara:strand:+ start:644 stop:1189 length:546 start_codon:yes stop_codon:yes gene_type:complete
MSRIGNKPIQIPSGVTVEIAERLVTIKGPKGELSQYVNEGIKLRQEEDQILVERETESKQHKALHGLIRSLVANMVEGVFAGFEKSLELIGVGYRAQQVGDGVNLQLGFSHTIDIQAKEGITFELEGNNLIKIQGIDKQAVGEVAANIRKLRKPNVYTGKGVRYVGEQVRRKAGKSGASGG